MNRKIDLTGRIFGKLTVISEAIKETKNSPIRWICKCECGNHTSVVTKSLLANNGTKSCGCLSKKAFKDITGKKINHLTAISYIGQNTYKNRVWKCQCDCGKTIDAEYSDIIRGKVKSCGCGKIIGTLNNSKYKVQPKL